MPGRNGAGPEGNGAMTGRGLGNCSSAQEGANTSDNQNQGPGLGRGLGLGRGNGRGRRSGGNGMGRGRGRGFGNGQGFNTNNTNPVQNAQQSSEEELNTNQETSIVETSKIIPTVEISEVEIIPEKSKD